MSFHMIPPDELRALCKREIESLERWLRIVINREFSAAHGTNYFDHVDAHGNRLIKGEIVKSAKYRMQKEPNRYKNAIAAVLLDDAIAIVSNARHWKNHFAAVLGEAFPCGNDEARTFLSRLSDPRNRLAHEHPITVRQAEQVICYSHDTIESIKHYLASVQGDDFKAPFITRISDSLGYELTFDAPASGG